MVLPTGEEFLIIEFMGNLMEDVWFSMNFLHAVFVYRDTNKERSYDLGSAI
jgi:hypothetical protein